ncbi:hypothetical protein NC653_022168 [Populus alba x Populus x berolinensis]|uniref:Uncharacterized protein n=1 Tax=Populus alba x Populus x berolinensis TaxID=444605 RepID=A0AAD6VV21_9ROSI|nr:hypothetical protein NC653_022168 [Populus alba x Populus x berolinensis]
MPFHLSQTLHPFQLHSPYNPFICSPLAPPPISPSLILLQTEILSRQDHAIEIPPERLLLPPRFAAVSMTKAEAMAKV